MIAKDFLRKHHSYIHQYAENGYEYNTYKIMPISCIHEGDTITVPLNYQDYDYLYIVQNINIENKRQMYFVNVDDIEDKLKSSQFPNSGPCFSKRHIATLRKNNKVYDSLKELLQPKTQVKATTTSYSIF